MSELQINRQRVQLFNAQAANGVSEAINVSRLKVIKIVLFVPASTTLTVKCVGGYGATKPDFSAAQSATNLWGFNEMRNKNNDAQVVGATGVSYAAPGAAVWDHYIVNESYLDWIALVVSGHSAGSLSAWLYGRE